MKRLPIVSLALLAGCAAPVCTDRTSIRAVMGPVIQQRFQCHSYDLMPSPDARPAERENF